MSIMEIEIESKRNNPLLNRTEIHFTIKHIGEKTPNRELIRTELAEKLNAKKDNVIVNIINSGFGTQETTGYAKIYLSQKQSMDLEKDHILIRNKLLKKGGKDKAKPAEGAPASPSTPAPPAPAEVETKTEQPSKPSKEEQTPTPSPEPVADETKEEKPIEEKADEPPVEEQKETISESTKESADETIEEYKEEKTEDKPEEKKSEKTEVKEKE